MDPRRALLVALALASCGAPEPSRPRTVVVVVVDTLRADHLSAYGYERDTSPHLAELAGDGLLFTNCQAQSSWTKPATASLLTGRLPSAHGAEHAISVLEERHVTLAEHLAAAGFRTGGISANGFVVGGGMGFDQGFEHFAERITTEDPGYVRAGVLVDEALAWIDAQGDEPLFLYLHVIDPHAPYLPPPPFDERFCPGHPDTVAGDFGVAAEAGGLPADLGPADWAHLRDQYDGEIAYTDDCVGRLLAGLDERGRGADALVAVVSDHGEEFGEHGGWRHGPGLYQEVLHVPLVLRVPGLEPELRGMRVDALAQQVDLLPTILDSLDLPVPSELDGTSLLTIAREGAGPTPRTMVSEVDQNGLRRRALRVGGLKLIHTTVPDEGMRLYDLATDPAEASPLERGGHPAGSVLAETAEALAAAELSGWVLTVRVAGEELREVETIVGGGTLPLATVRPLGVEGPDIGWREDLDGPFEPISGEVDGRTLSGMRLVTRTRPGDRDGLVLETAADETQLFVSVAIDGRPARPDEILLGPAGSHPPTVPFTIDLADVTAYSTDELADGPLADGETLEVRLVHRPPARVEELALTPAARDALRGIGYLGDD
jgi:arylsulfatase